MPGVQTSCRLRPVPVLHAGRNMNHRARQNLYGRFSFFLIPVTASHSDKHLSAAFSRPVNMPVVAASRFKGHIEYRHLFLRNRSQVTLTDKVLCKCGIRFSDWENHFVLESCLCLFSGYIFRPHFLGLTESGPCFRPSGIKGNVRNDFRDFRTGDAVLLGSLQVISQ